MNLFKTLKIGNVNIPNRLFLSPMVDVTDLAYRELCRKQGAGMAYTEMLYVDAILHENDKTKKLMVTNTKDRPVGIQVTGNSVAEFEKLSKLEDINNYDLIDINCGCPSIRIVGSEAGSFLLNNPDKIAQMIKILKDSGQTVTAKIRLGFKENNALKIASKIEKAGADALTVHARLATQSNKFPAEWVWISKIKKNCGIPVIGNGDVTSGKDAEKMVNEAGCDAVMIARGAIGNPFIFREIARYVKTGKEKEITRKEKISAFNEYLKLVKKYDIVDLGRVKYIGNAFFSGFDGASRFRADFSSLKSFEEIVDFSKLLA